MKLQPQILYKWTVSLLIAFSLLSNAYGQSAAEREISIITDSIETNLKTDFGKAMLFFDSYRVACQGIEAAGCTRDSMQLLKAKILLGGAKYLLRSNVDTARVLVDQSIDIYSRLNEDQRLHDAIFTSADIHYADGTMREGLADFESYIDYHSAVNHEYEVARGYYKKASCFRRLGVQDSTIVYLHNASSVFEKLEKWNDAARCYQVFGIVYRDLKQYDISEEYLDNALRIFEDEKNIAGQAKIMTCYGNNTYSKGDTLGCISYYRTAGRLNEQANSVEGVFVNYYNTANAFFQLAKYDSALVYVEKANGYRDQLGMRHRYMISYKQGTILIEQEQYEQGIPLLEQAMKSALMLEGYIDARDMSDYLSRGYASLGDHENAYRYARKYANLKDSVITIESNKTINELKAKYETEKKEIQIENLELVNSQQFKFLIGGGLALALISLLSFFLFRLYSRIKVQKTIISKSLKEKDLLLREIHHRVKNNLQLVSSLLTLQGRSIDDSVAQQAINEGKNRVRSMALIHQDLYNKENLTGISVKQYLEKLTTELFQTYRIDRNRITMATDIQDIELDVDTMVPLGLIINELITNSLKYAFPEENTGSILVKLYENDNKLELLVKDNGVGYDPQSTRENSFGSTLITALTEQLEGEIVTNSTDGTETIIIFLGHKSS